MQLLSKLMATSLTTRLVFVCLFAVFANQSVYSKTQTVKILVLGDSISAEYGLKRGTGWVALLESRMAESVNWNEKPKAGSKGPQNAIDNIAPQAINTPATGQNGIKILPNFNIINASISGETTAGGRARLAALLARHKPSHVIIELGANDALRGLPVAAAQNNLNAMTQMALQSGAKVLIVGMQIPPNYGQDYTQQFSAVFGNVVKANQNAKPKSKHAVALVPFMLKGVADSPEYLKLFQADRIHPTEAAQMQILNNVWVVLLKQLN
ncbi:MAG TPA: arylesterase [Burkholderiaceae bacterium]|nr:arylesterase [Burkholderiaceae bacterium]